MPFEPVRSAEPPIRLGSAVDQFFENRLRGLPRRKLWGIGGEFRLHAGNRLAQCRAGFARDHALEIGAARIVLEAPKPRLPLIFAARRRRAPGIEDCLGHLEMRIAPTQRLAGLFDFVGAERRAVSCGGALLGRGAVADDRLAGDEARPVGLARGFDGGGDLGLVVAVNPADIPAGGGEPAELIHRGRQRGRAVDRDAVVVEQHDQLRQPQMTGEVDRLVADPLHQAAIARERISVVIDQRVAKTRVQKPLGERHADGVRNALAERAGRGFDTRRVTIFRMPGGNGTELTEMLQLVQRHLRIAGEIEQRIEQHRAVPRRQHEAVAVRPVRRGGIEFQEAREQHRRHIGHTHRHSRMPRICGLHGVHRKGADGVGEITKRRFGGGGLRGLKGHGCLQIVAFP